MNSKPSFITKVFTLNDDAEREAFKRFINKVDGENIGVTYSDGRELDLNFFVSTAKIEIGFFTEGEADYVEASKEGERCVDELIEECRKG